MLRELSKSYRVPLLGYCITSNHVHLLVTAPDKSGVSNFMDSLAGDFAQYYNIRKERSGAFWDGRFHATAIEGGEHFWRCLIYIDMNMVRAGAVGHPSDWKWCSCDELTGKRKRYRLIDLNHFSGVTGIHPQSGEFQSKYLSLIEEQLRAGRLHRQPRWSQALAVGSQRYVKRVERKMRGRRNMETNWIEAPYNSTWVLREVSPSYNA